MDPAGGYPARLGQVIVGASWAIARNLRGERMKKGIESDMTHPDRKKAKRFDMPGRSAAYTDAVYSGTSATSRELRSKMSAAENAFHPPAPEYNLYYGEMHGHSNLSDGSPDIDSYWRNIRDNAKLDFGVLSDHDHGGVGNDELWKGKWDIIRTKAKEYYEPGKFTTLLAYERDSYPWYNNLVVYYDGHDGEMLRGVRDGEFMERELRAALARGDILLCPHDTYSLSSGTDFLAMDVGCMTPLIEVISRGDSAEYFDHPIFGGSCCEGGTWQDALRRGARMGCIGGSDDHDCKNGLTAPELGFPRMHPGITGVWTAKNTVEGIFSALKARRCYGFMGGRMKIDFRINGHWMGEEFRLPEDEDRVVWFDVEADAPVDRLTLVKNCRDYVILKWGRQLVFDYAAEQDVDIYYLRVQLTDGRWGWSSPIWVNRE